MDTKRLVLYVALGLILYSLWNTWQQEHTPPVSSLAQPLHQATQPNGLLPTLPVEKTAQNASAAASGFQSTSNKKTSTTQSIHVKTDVLSLIVDLTNGDIIKAQLLQYPVRFDAPNEPVSLLFDEASKRYIASSNLVVADDTVHALPVHYTSDKTSYIMSPDEKTLTVTLNGTTDDGLAISKQLTLTRGSYLINVTYDIKNQGQAAFNGYLNNQLIQTAPTEDASSVFHVGSYTGASYSVPGKHRYQKVSYKAMEKSQLTEAATGGWIAMQQHYFVSAFVPNANSKNTIYTRSMDDSYTIGMVGQSLLINPSDEKQLTTQLYLGPEDPETLKAIAPGLDLTVDYGWLWFLSSLLFSLMKAIHGLVGNWGWSIVLVTILIKLAFYRLSATSYRSMAGMRKLQPKLQSLKERYGDDKTRISQETMALYKAEKVNPLGGCLPIVIQIPVFIALYWVLLESVALRQAPFIFWIKDLAVADPYHILPIIMGLTMLVQQRLNPAPPDPMQAKMMMLLPIVFTGLFWSFPAGLVLYWIVNNTLSILQQWYITKKYADKEPTSKKPLAFVK